MYNRSIGTSCTCTLVEFFPFSSFEQEAMMEGVAVCRPGACLTEVGSAIHAVADHYGFDTVQK